MQITPNRLLRGSLLAVVYLLGILGIAASGGDDGPTSISYSGNTNPAVISRSNAARLVGNVLIGQTIVGSSSGGAAKGVTSIDTTAQGIGLAQFPNRLVQMVRNTMKSSPVLLSRSIALQARTDLDETEPCDNNGGSLRITGFIEDNGTGTLTLDYINCREGEETLDGTVTAQINAFDFVFSIPTDAIYNFEILTITSSTINASLSGSIYSKISTGTETEQLIVDELIARNNVTDEMLMIRNHVSVIDYDNIFSPSSFSETITGRIYDSTHGYVDFSTIVAIKFGSITQEYPDSGQLLLTGSLNSGIRITVISNTHTSFDLDLDGDTTFEITHTVSWAEIEVETDLIDTDDDGMHDSWEQSNGFDPNNSEDINLDGDIDGASNIEEYKGGADPNDGGSIPTSADLSVDMSAFPAAVFLGDSLIYNITVRNNGPNDVNDVIVEDTLPVGMTLNSVIPSQGTCIGTSIITCFIGLMIDNSSTTIDIVATPTSEGVVTNSVIVTSGTLDLDPTNNIATMSGGAGSSASVIQTQIDAAVDGDTILVAPGVYIGTINITGKNITVASEQGPLVTVIDGNRLDSVVTINSNSSALEGFTIQNGSAFSGGGGINIGGSAATIQNNIVANNLGCSGGGMHLGFTSAIVQKNTVRNNRVSCSGGEGAGISIVGAGSAVVIDNYIYNNTVPSSNNGAGGISMNAAGTPTIQDNIISGNTGGAISMGNLSDALILQNIISNNSGVNCGGIEWLVPSSGDGPRVINNTIVYNDGAQGSAICADGFDAQTLLVNNIIVAKAGQTAIYCGDFNSLESPMVEFNNVYASPGMGFGGICTDKSGISGNVFGDPLFIDITNEGYQLRATSPSIDVGDNAIPEIPALDIVGNTRFIDGDQNGSTIVDMGAYEYIP